MTFKEDFPSLEAEEFDETECAFCDGNKIDEDGEDCSACKGTGITKLYCDSDIDKYCLDKQKVRDAIEKGMQPPHYIFNEMLEKKVIIDFFEKELGL